MIPPHTYWKTLRDLCDEYGTLLIADEVQTAINRTGAFFAVNHEGVTPDFITTAKALGNGFPIAACLTTDDVAAACTKPAASTYGANPIACRVALAVLDCHSKNDLKKQSLARGQYLTSKLNRIAEGSDLITDVRGRGLMIGVELGNARQNAAADVTEHVLEAMKDQGVLLGKTGLGRNVVTFMPPLIITEPQLDDACEKFQEVLQGISSV